MASVSWPEEAIQEVEGYAEENLRNAGAQIVAGIGDVIRGSAETLMGNQVSYSRRR